MWLIELCQYETIVTQTNLFTYPIKLFIKLSLKIWEIDGGIYLPQIPFAARVHATGRH